MQNSENNPLLLPFASKDNAAVENKLLVAATVAAVVLAGSAIAYRHAVTNPASTMGLFWKDSRTFEEELESEKSVENTVGSDTTIGFCTVSTSTTTYPTAQELEHNTANTAGTTKSSRPKDRRKRGKDPLREVLKSGKKLKSFPNPAGSSSIPPSPTPSAAILSSSVVEKGNRVGENTELSCETARAHPLDASQVSPEYQRIPAEGIQREHSPLTSSIPAIHLSAAGHSRDVSQHSRSTHDEGSDLAGDRDGDFPGVPSYGEYAHARIHSPNSLSQSSLSLPRSPSSLADVSEGEPEDGGWVTSVSKSRSKHRARLQDVMFEDIRARSGGLAHNGLGKQAEDDGMATKETTRDDMHQGPEVTESYSNSTIVFEGSSMFPPSNEAAISFLSTDLPRYASCSDTSSEAGDAHRLMQAKQEYPQGLPHPTHWDRASTSQSTVNPMTSDEVLDDADDREQDRKQPRFQHTPFSSAVTGGGRGSRSGLTETEPEGGQIEFTFPTLNSQVTSSSGPSTRARSTITDSSVSSSSSKKNKRFSSGKNGTPPNVPPSRTSSPSNTRENHAHSQGSNAIGGSPNTAALSAQTQLASLRGALEAARLREEKHKTEMEKVTKELDMLKWQNTINQRGEVELQAQVRQLTHQLQNYAALFASVAPHLNSHFSLQPHPESPKIDPAVEIPNGGVDRAASESPEHETLEQVAETQEEEAVPSDKAQGQIPASPPTQQPQPPSPVNDVASRLVGAQHVGSPPPSAAIPTFFPYYLPTQHPQFPVHHSPWVYHSYQQQSTQNVSGAAGGPSSPPPPRHYANVYSPTMYPISPVPPPHSPQSIGVTSPQLLHQYQSFGFGGGFRSTGASSAGSHSPEMAGASGFGSGLNKLRPRIRRRKSQLTNLNGNARSGWEDIGDGWIGLSRVVMQPTATNIDKGRTDEGPMADGEGEDDVESASSPYSELLADAILKRSSTIRPSKKNGKKDNGPLVSQEGAEEAEPLTEFTFPSLSNGNDYYRTASRTESSVSSSLSSSPPSTTATVPDIIGDGGWEDDKASLPSVIEHTEVLDHLVLDVVLRETRRDVPLSKDQDNTVTQEVTPKQEDHEQTWTDSLKQ